MMTDGEIVLRLVLAAVFGGIVGVQRELRHKTAGFRTNILICLGAALLTVVSIKITQDFTRTVADPGRIAAQIVTGIGFLGAGAIIQSRGSVIGLTTAATIWVTAAIGMAIGCGYYLAGGVVVLVTVIILQALVPFELSLRKKRISAHYYVKYARNAEMDALIKRLYEEAFVKIDDIRFDVADDMTVVRFNISHSPEAHDKFMQEVRALDPGALCMHF